MRRFPGGSGRTRCYRKQIVGQRQIRRNGESAPLQKDRIVTKHKLKCIYMTEFEYRQAVDCMIRLCGSAVNGTVPDRAEFVSVDLDCLFEVAEKHMLSSIVGQALQAVGISSPSFKNAVAAAQRKAVILEHDFESVASELEKAGIWYMPLKGAVLKDDYPRFAMREMCDYDVLFDASRADDVRSIMENLGFTVRKFGIGADDGYNKPPVSNIEMHRELFGSYLEEKLHEYYRDVKSKLMKEEGSEYRYRFTPEDFYLYMVAHEYKHYSNSGTGLRSLLDTCVFLKKHRIDEAYVEREAEKLGIAEFERKNRSLATALFDGAVLTNEEHGMLDYFLSSGTYGSMRHKVENRLHTHSKSKIRYLIRRIFGPGKNDPDRGLFEKKYMVFFKYKILLPFLPFYRLFRALKKSPEQIKAEMNTLRIV